MMRRNEALSWDCEGVVEAQFAIAISGIGSSTVVISPDELGPAHVSRFSDDDMSRFCGSTT